MEREFVPFDLAVRLKELGFDEMCFGVYIDGKFEPRYKSRNSKFNPNKKLDKRNSIFCTSPLWQQAFDFLLKKYRLYGILIPTVTMYWTFKTITAVEGMAEVPPYNHVDGNDYHRIEHSRQVCLEKLIEIVENEKYKLEDVK